MSNTHKFSESDERLGTLLVRKKIITPQQLDQAVQCQVLFGGRLGSNLLELGFVTEAQLRQVLVEKTKIPAVTRAEFADLPAEAINLIPPSLAVKYQVIPLRKSENTLILAMLDPFRESTLQLLQEVTGLVIEPRIALELDLAWALERYYAVKREARFVNLDRWLEHQREQEKAGRGGSSPFAPEAIFPDPESITAIEGAPRTLEDFWDRVGRSGHPEQMLPRVLRDLEGASSRDEIGSIILDFASFFFARTILFVIKEDILFGWDARGEGMDRRLATAIMLPLSRRSLFKTVVETSAYFLGPVPDSTINRRFFEALGPEPPKTVLAFPIFVAGKVAAILYGDRGPGEEVSSHFLPLQRALTVAGQAFQRLILKQKADNLRFP